LRATLAESRPDVPVGRRTERAPRPADARAGREHPVIVFSRGSWTRPNGFAGEMLVMAHRFAQAGFLGVAPQYRGSNGWRGRDELGRADLHDLLNHGGAEQDIPVSQSQSMDAELTRLGKTHDFIVFDGKRQVIAGRGASAMPRPSRGSGSLAADDTEK
jgi:dipeptidyl aminopeptidase/acylaminoacyl peptidase